MSAVVYVFVAVIFSLLFGYQLGKNFSGQALRTLADSLHRLKKDAEIKEKNLDAELRKCREQISVLQEYNRENPGIQDELQQLQIEYKTLEHKYLIACEDRKKEERLAQLELQKLEIEWRANSARIRTMDVQNAEERCQSRLKQQAQRFEQEIQDALLMSKVEAIDHFEAQKDKMQAELTRMTESTERITAQVQQKREMRKNMKSESLDLEIVTLESEGRLNREMKEIFMKRMERFSRYIKLLEDSL